MRHARDACMLLGTVSSSGPVKAWARASPHARASREPAVKRSPATAASTLLIWQVHLVIDEIIAGGIVIETSMQEVLDSLEAQSKLMRNGAPAAEIATAALQGISAMPQR